MCGVRCSIGVGLVVRIRLNSPPSLFPLKRRLTLKQHPVEFAVLWIAVATHMCVNGWMAFVKHFGAPWPYEKGIISKCSSFTILAFGEKRNSFPQRTSLHWTFGTLCSCSEKNRGRAGTRGQGPSYTVSAATKKWISSAWPWVAPKRSPTPQLFQSNQRGRI